MLQSKITILFNLGGTGGLSDFRAAFMVTLLEQQLTVHSSPSLLILFWILMSASGIFLFMLAVKKAHRLWIDEERSLKEKRMKLNNKAVSARKRIPQRTTNPSTSLQLARKLVRRIPENASTGRGG